MRIVYISTLLLAFFLSVLGVTYSAAVEEKKTAQIVEKTFEQRYGDFLQDTEQLRAEYTAIQNERKQLLLTENPDKNKLAMLTEQIYQVSDTLRGKATAAGLERRSRSGGCSNCGGGGCGVPTTKPSTEGTI